MQWKKDVGFLVIFSSLWVLNLEAFKCSHCPRASGSILLSRSQRTLERIVHETSFGVDPNTVGPMPGPGIFGRPMITCFSLFFLYLITDFTTLYFRCFSATPFCNSWRSPIFITIILLFPVSKSREKMSGQVFVFCRKKRINRRERSMES